MAPMNVVTVPKYTFGEMLNVNLIYETPNKVALTMSNSANRYIWNGGVATTNAQRNIRIPKRINDRHIKLNGPMIGPTMNWLTGATTIPIPNWRPCAIPEN